jgi:small-conductance mechanosensitive channel
MALMQNKLVLMLFFLLFLGNGLSLSQTPPASTPQTADIVAYLRETITWYRGTAVEQQIATEPSDLTFLNSNRPVSSRIVRLAFDFARLEEQNESKRRTENSSQGQAASSSQYERLIQAAANADLKVEQSKKELQSLRKKLETAPDKKRPDLESLIAETQSEIAFHETRRDALHNILQFAESSSNGLGVAGLRAQIEEIARSVPAPLSESDGASQEQSSTGQTTPKPASSIKRDQPVGIWGLAANLFQLSRKKYTLDQRIRSTDQLMQISNQVRRPLVAHLRSLIQSGDQLAGLAPPSDSTVLAQQKRQLDALTDQFKLASAGLLPISKQRILLDLYKGTLTNWIDTLQNEYKTEMQSFLIRLGVLILVISAIFTAGEGWRRAIFRYVREPRRRYQFLLLRKISIWIATGAIIAFTFASEMGSIATFAGLLTAGVVVALQSVILSVAAYFFLMGKYGIRVGDRVQIAGVTGEVVDIGLVRLHLLELSGGGMDAHPSGRVVAFSNSVVFQPASGGVFRKIPGTSFVWHEISLTFSPESNYTLIQDRMTAAVDNVLKDHREEIERQSHHMEQTLNSISAIELKPKVLLRSTTAGIEVTVRFPVELQNAVDIDGHMMREINVAIEQEPKLKLAGPGAPTLRTESSDPTHD